MNKIFQILSLFVIVCLSTCSDSGDNTGEDPPITSNRSFFMGFSPWPYDATVEATTYTYTLIQDHGDIISHHLMSGIPWQASYDETSLPGNTEDDISSRINQTGPNKAILLSIDSLNTSRDDLESNWGESGEEPRPTPWDTLGFDDLEVAEAYSNFALDMIERFDPAYFNYAPEVSELILNDPEKFEDFVVFAERVYQNIKAAHPNLPLLVSISLKSPDSPDTAAIQSNIASLSEFIDVVGISVYPYAFYEHNDRGDPTNMPAGWVSQISSIAGNKPIAITETAWIAENLTIDNYGYSEQSSTDKQANYISELLSSADQLSMEFVIWFAIVDYDALWNGILGQDDLSKIWKDTGLYDENLNPRPALDIWNEYYSREKI